MGKKKRVEKKSLNALIPGCCVSNELGLVGSTCLAC